MLRRARVAAHRGSDVERFAWERSPSSAIRSAPLSGSHPEDAIQWAVREMKKDGLDNVHTEPVKVPHWVRGQESIEITAPRRAPMVMLGLGNSIGTPAEGVEAEVLVVRSFEELDAAGARVKGRIVLFNAPFTNYGETVQFRGAGPSRAAALGAVAALVRSVGPAGLRLPHNGSPAGMRRGCPQIPAAALTTEDSGPAPAHAGSRHPGPLRLRWRRSSSRCRLLQQSSTELRGRETPGEVCW